MYENENYSDGTSRYEYGTYSTNASTGTGSVYGTGNPNLDAKQPQKGSGFFKKALLGASLGLLFGMFAGLGFYAVAQGTGLLERQTASQMDVSAIVEKAADEVEARINKAEKTAGAVTTTEMAYTGNTVAEITEQVMPAMVSIINTYSQTFNYWGRTYSEESRSSGSGIIVGETDTELLIVSNNHVVADANSLEVTFIDGSTAQALIKGTDADMDLAVIAVQLDSLTDETKAAITVAALGNSDDLVLGEEVIAIGNALGYGQSVTNGIISALNREMTTSDGITSTYIQTNAAINPGNSGGALLNMRGEVIGINSNKIVSSDTEGMGYAIPITTASPIIADLMERQTKIKVEDGQSGYLGIANLQTVSEQISSMYGMPVGVYVGTVQEGSAAENAGIRKGDIVVKFDGEKITSITDLQEELQYYHAGTEVKVTIRRVENGEYVEHDMMVTLGARPKE